MKGYRLARALYRSVDRHVVRRLPAAAERRLRVILLQLARAAFGARIKARSAGEFAARSDALNSSEGIPEWAALEIRELAQFEPALGALVAPGARVEVYRIPWDKTYLGEMYAKVRRRLASSYASMVLAGAAARADVAGWLPDAPRPLAVIDIDDDPDLLAVAAAAGVDYLALPMGDLDINDRAALLARVILQLRPVEVRYARHVFLDACRERHGLAMAAVARLVALPVASRQG